VSCEFEYLPRTEGVSSIAIKKHISSSDSLSSMARVDSGYLPSPGMSPSGSASYDNVNRRIAERILDEKDKEEWKDSYELDEEKEGRKEGRAGRAPRTRVFF
jgi:hypothetical protein